MGLLTCDVSRLADGDGASLDVGEREITDFASYCVGVVTAWSLAFLLDKGMNLSFQEGSVRGNLDFDDGGIASDASQIHAVGRGKVAEAVGNEAAVIDLHASYDVWAVAIDHISTIIDGEMGKGAQVATVLAQGRTHGRVAGGYGCVPRLRRGTTQPGCHIADAARQGWPSRC